jgi:predicted N-acetyltransferase YhbS
MEIRKLIIDNYEEITKLWTRASLPYEERGRDRKEAMAAEMKANPEFFLGAFEDGHLVGTVIINCDMRKGWLNRLAVDPDYRHCGIAKALIAESEKILKKHGVRVICALIEDYNTASKKLFNECGYTEHHDIIYFSKRDSNEV